MTVNDLMLSVGDFDNDNVKECKGNITIKKQRIEERKREIKKKKEKCVYQTSNFRFPDI